MATNFSSLPIIDLDTVKNWSGQEVTDEIIKLSSYIRQVFQTVGFGYIVNHGVSYSHDDILRMCKEFFSIDIEAKMALAKRSFVPTNGNTYRGYFPVQQGDDSYKEGFEIGQIEQSGGTDLNKKFNLLEANVWPKSHDGLKRSMQNYYQECLALGDKLMRLIALAFDLDVNFFRPYFDHSISTLRFLHYPSRDANGQQLLSCAAHTDSGILTILYQDQSGGLEVLNSAGKWIPAPYVSESYVINLGDLMSRWTGGYLVSTQHRVRAVVGRSRFSVPFFFEPNINSIIAPITTAKEGHQSDFEPVKYGHYLINKMTTWVEYQ